MAFFAYTAAVLDLVWPRLAVLALRKTANLSKGTDSSTAGFSAHFRLLSARAAPGGVVSFLGPPYSVYRPGGDRGWFLLCSGVTQRWGTMETEPGTSSPHMPELTLDAPPPATSVEAMSAVLESFLARFEAASAQKGGKKRPPP